jgi:adenine-specific DNA-methyltransferase
MMTKRLELVWPNKDKLLLGLDENGKPIWGTKDDLEPRLLVQLEAVGQTNPDNLDDLYEQGDSLLIRGDNLLALKALERHFAGKIKCIYIDPPFNTGNAFEHYDDGLEHTIWLSMMKARLELLKKFLRKDDGLIFVHIDYREFAQLKLLMDEIFGPHNFLSFVTLKVKDPAGVGQQSLVFDVCEYLLVYARDFNALRNRITKPALDFRVVDGPIKGYNKAMIDFGTPVLCKVIHRQNVGEIKIYRCEGYKIRRFGKKDSYGDYLQHFDRVFADYNPSGGTILQIRNEFPENELSFMEYVPTKGKDAGQLARVYFLNRRILAWLRDIAEVDEEGQITKKAKLTNLWEVPNAQLFSEGGVDFRQSKKPEVLIQKVIELSTSSGEWVLDSFLGSGTTAAVAHKLGRKWIGVEIGEHAETHCLPRLKRVVSGEDQTGISKQVGWKGGGGFRYCVLGESLFAKDKDTGLVMINPKYTNGPLVAAVCNLEDFRLNNDSVFQGVRGSLNAHVTEEKVTQAYLDTIVEQLPDGKSLTIYCLKRATGLKIPPEVKIKRIPKELQIPRYLTNSGKGGTE